MSKQCLILGGGSKFGRHLTEHLIDTGYRVRLVTSSPDHWQSNSMVEVVPVNWRTISIADIRPITTGLADASLVFFNQNSSALNLENFKSNKPQSPQHWQQNYFVACQLPFYIVQVIRSQFDTAKVAWMLSSLIKNPQNSQIGYADYVGNKFTNYCIMKSFSQTAKPGECFFAMHPDGIAGPEDSTTKAQNMIKFMDQSQPELLNGQVFSHLGHPMTLG